MAIDLNMDMGSIIKGLMSKHSGGGVSFASGAKAGQLSLAPYKFAIIIFALVILVSGGYIATVYIPLKEKNNAKKAELTKVLEMKGQLSVLDGQIVMLKKKLDKSKEEYLESLAHFGNSEDLGGLYQTVSTLAIKYGLVVLNLKEIPAPPPPPVAKPAAKTPAVTADSKEVKKEPAVDDAPKKPAIDVKEVKVEVELKGHYGEYIKFKEDLALAEVLLKVNSETIMVKDEKTEQGSIYVKLNLSTYAIDKKPFQGIIAENEHEKTN